MIGSSRDGPLIPSGPALQNLRSPAVRNVRFGGRRCVMPSHDTRVFTLLHPAEVLLDGYSRQGRQGHSMQWLIIHCNSCLAYPCIIPSPCSVPPLRDERIRYISCFGEARRSDPAVVVAAVALQSHFLPFASYAFETGRTLNPLLRYLGLCTTIHSLPCNRYDICYLP